MDRVNWTKLITLLMVGLGTIILAGMKIVSAEAAIGTLSACLGYVFGNGHGLAEAQRYVSKNLGKGN